MTNSNFNLIFLFVYLLSLGVILIFPKASESFKSLVNNTLAFVKVKMTKPLSVDDLHIPFELNEKVKSGKKISQQWSENNQLYVYVGEQGVLHIHIQTFLLLSILN